MNCLSMREIWLRFVDVSYVFIYIYRERERDMLDWGLQLSYQFEHPYFLHDMIYLRFWLILEHCIVFACLHGLIQ